MLARAFQVYYLNDVTFPNIKFASRLANPFIVRYRAYTQSSSYSITSRCDNIYCRRNNVSTNIIGICVLIEIENELLLQEGVGKIEKKSIRYLYIL